MNHNSFLGIDVSKDKFDVHLISGQETWSGQFDNSQSGFRQLQRWLQKRQMEAVHACMEATGSYGEALALFLHAQGHQVSVVNPRIIKHYGQSKMQRNKTDRLDARLIAQYCQKEAPRLWQPPTEAERTLQALTRRLEALIENRTREQNRLKSLTHPAVVRQSIEDSIAFYTHQIQTLEKLIEDHINQHPDLKLKRDLLVSIPSIGNKTAAIILSEMPNPALLASSKQATAYAGLTPKQLQSGKSNRTGGVYKLGSRRLRTALFYPALTGKVHNPILRQMAERLAQRGITGMSAIAALMRKLLQLAYGVLKSERPFDPEYAVKVQVAT